MQEIVSGVFTFTGLIAGRVYLITEGDGLTLIDAGIPPSGKRIVAQLRAAGHNPARIKRLIITHAHPDHVGGIPDLQKESEVALIVPSGERAAFEGEIPIPSAPTWLKPPATTLKNLKSDQLLEDGDVIEGVLGGLQAVSTPGHAPGHMAYWQPDRKILFCGDTIFNMTKMRLPYKFVTVDMAQNIQSIGRMAVLNPEVICFGHGKPIIINAAQHLQQFAQKVGAV